MGESIFADFLGPVGFEEKTSISIYYNLFFPVLDPIFWGFKAVFATLSPILQYLLTTAQGGQFPGAKFRSKKPFLDTLMQGRISFYQIHRISRNWLKKA